MVTVGFSRTRAARSWKCGQRNRLLRTSWTTVSWTESWLSVIEFCGLTCCLVGARPGTGRLCSRWSIHPQSTSDRGEVRCLLRAQTILKRLTEPEGTTSVFRLRDSWTSPTTQTALVSVRLWGSIKRVKLILQAWCCQMFSVRSIGNVALLKQTHTLKRKSATDRQKLRVQFQTYCLQENKQNQLGQLAASTLHRSRSTSVHSESPVAHSGTFCQ